MEVIGHRFSRAELQVNCKLTAVLIVKQTFKLAVRKSVHAFFCDGKKRLIELTEVFDIGLEACFLNCYNKVLSKTREIKGDGLTVIKHELHLLDGVDGALVDIVVYPHFKVPLNKFRLVRLDFRNYLEHRRVAVIILASVPVHVSFREEEEVFNVEKAL